MEDYEWLLQLNYSLLNGTLNRSELWAWLSRHHQQHVDNARHSLPSNISWLGASSSAKPGGQETYEYVPDECFPLMDMLDFFHLYYIPAIILVGLVGNLLSCVVFLNTHLKMRSSSYYLAALAVADFGFLATLLLVWLNNNLGVLVFNKDGWCQGLVYLSSVCSFLSVWLIVAFTVERFIAVQYPLHRPHMCTIARAKTIVLSLTLVALVTHAYSFVTAGINGQGVCDLREGYHETMRVINIIDSFLTLIVPLVLIVVMNTMIVRNLIRFSRRFHPQDGNVDFNERSDIVLQPLHSSSSNSRKAGLAGPALAESHHSSTASHASQPPSRANRSASASAPPPTPSAAAHALSANKCIHIRASSRNLASTKTQQSITKMLLLISSVFVLLNLPSYVIRLYVFVCFSLWRQTTPDLLWCMQQFFMLLYYTNFSINFLLYSMCGITFRRCLWQLIRNRLKALTRYHCNVLVQR